MRMTDVQLLRSFHEPLHKLIPHLGVHIDSLYGDADLPGVSKTAGDTTAHGFLQIRIVLDDDGRIRTQLQSDALHSRQVADAQSHIDTPRECHHRDAFVEYQHVPDRAARPGDYVE